MGVDAKLLNTEGAAASAAIGIVAPNSVDIQELAKLDVRFVYLL